MEDIKMQNIEEKSTLTTRCFSSEKMLTCWRGLASNPFTEDSSQLSTRELLINQMKKVRNLLNDQAYQDPCNLRGIFEPETKKSYRNVKRVKREIGLVDALKELIIEDLKYPIWREEDILNETLGLLLIQDDAIKPYLSVNKPVVPIGPRFQNQGLPDCTQKNHRNSDDADELKWLGIKVWPLPDEDLEDSNGENIVKGRNERRLCENARSVECARLHISEARARLQLQIGPAFSIWEFHEMGETYSKHLEEKEEKKFNSLVKAHPLFDHSTDFWKLALKHIQKPRKTLIKYYYNVYCPRWAASETRSKLCEIDGDNDNPEDKQNKEWLKKKKKISCIR